PHLPRREIVAEEGVGLLGRGEAGILADGPGAPRIHRRPRAPDKGRSTRQAGEMLQRLEIGGGVEWLDGGTSGGLPVEDRHRLAGEFALGSGRPIGQRFLVRLAHHSESVSLFPGRPREPSPEYSHWLPAPSMHRPLMARERLAPNT